MSQHMQKFIGKLTKSLKKRVLALRKMASIYDMLCLIVYYVHYVNTTVIVSASCLRDDTCSFDTEASVYTGFLLASRKEAACLSIPELFFHQH